jgi:hypothetical protein
MQNWVMAFLFAATCAAPLVAGASGGSDGTSGKGENLAESAGGIGGRCCSDGAFFCPDGTDWDYAPPRCGAMLKPAASAACHSHCGASCRDTGWQQSC